MSHQGLFELFNVINALFILLNFLDILIESGTKEQ